ncbi:hypothetical protein CFC21_025024 [Triticum aestivum]|uniref:DUF4220 domain-containing protein n=2 Tax=Triticum aestivum TaxID=4565 RepID=A0A3B6CBK1_WHEAT|nr:hypothetical protein CFC21_025024 [Triticum aestivum]
MIISGDTMNGVVEPAQRVWNTWGMHMLVLLSFTVQVTLQVFAEIRRRRSSGILLGIVWSAYMLADTVAVYTLGHFFTTNSSVEHVLMVLWAPLLLVHLGGQDNITALSIEDNQLWLRHLQNLGVQVVATASVLYQSSMLSHPAWLRAATILMFMVGVLKYGERVWALKRASGEPSRGFVDIFQEKQWEQGADKLYHKMQMKISQVYDVFYGKSLVMFSPYGICIRVICPLATVAALLLFHLVGDKDGLNSMDVTATYILLVGALVLETTSAFRLIFPKMLKGRWCGRHHESIEELIYSSMQKAGIHSMYWSGSMGQLDLFDMCRRTRSSPLGKIATWMGRWGRWIRLDFSWSIPVPTEIIQMLMEMMSDENLDQSWPDGGEATHRLDPEKKTEEVILKWHIGTQVYLKWYKEQQAEEIHGFTKAIEALSNYAVFLLAAHPLPPPVFPYENPFTLKNIMKCAKHRSAGKHLLRLLSNRNARYNYGSDQICFTELYGDSVGKTFESGFQIGAQLITGGMSIDKSLALFWMEMLKKLEQKLGEDFHVKQLSNGGELLTFLTILVQEETESMEGDETPLAKPTWPVMSRGRR